MTHAPPFLAQVASIVLASAVIAYVCHRLKVIPIVGFLLAGVLIGPNALGIVGDATLIDAMAEIGIVLLLFTLGMEFSLDRVWKIKRAIVIGGGLQVGLTILVSVCILSLFGVDWKTGFFTGALVALSSTAIVLRMLEHNDLSSERGQLSLGILIFQDLSIVALVLVLPALGGEGGSALDVARSLLVAAVIVGLIVVVARRVMPFVLERVARTCSPEIFLLTIIGICLGTAWLTSLAGVSLSLGAFLAGLLVSESRFSHHAVAEIMPLQILFSAVFFVSVGLLLDLTFVVSHPLLILAVVAAIVAVKALVTTAVGRMLGYSSAIAASTGLLLAQIGEFSFVLARAGRGLGLSPAGDEATGDQTFIAAAVLLMVMTPLLSKAGKRLEARRNQAAEERVAREAEGKLETEPVAMENHAIVAGYGSAARYLTRVLRDSGVPFVILTLSPTGATEAENEGLPVVLGDYGRQFLLDTANIGAAKMLIVPDDSADVASRVVAIARSLNPTLHIVVRTHSPSEVEGLLDEGADQVLVDELEVGVQLFTLVLAEYRVSEDEINDHVDTVRAGGYAALRSGIRDVPLVVCDELDDSCFDTRTFTVRRDADAPGLTVGELAGNGEVRVLMARRDGETIQDPPADFVLKQGDRVTARGSAAAFAQAAKMLRSRPLDDTAMREQTRVARTVRLTEQQRGACGHGRDVRPEISTAAAGCEECLAAGETWVHLRMCMQCGHVGCCDSSKNRHATLHWNTTGHPIIRSFQPGESWAWCYPDERML